MNLFIDTNILLSFYHLTGEDLEELRKLVVLCETGKVVLYVPSQVTDEYRRNREVKIADGLKTFANQKLPNQFPAICKQYGEYSKLRVALAACDDLRNQLLQKLDADVATHELAADKVIAALLSTASSLPATVDIHTTAQRRVAASMFQPQHASRP